MICKCTKLSVRKSSPCQDHNWMDASAESGAGRYCGGCIRQSSDSISTTGKPPKGRCSRIVCRDCTHSLCTLDDITV